MEYAIYPFDYIRISQRHDQGNHIPHWKPFKDYADKPWDEASKNTGRQYFIPQNDYVIEEVLIGYRSVRLRTLNKVLIPYQEEPTYLYITLTHMKKETLEHLKNGQIIHKNEKLILEGNEGGALGNHFHCTANLGKYYGIKHNSNGANCFVYDKSLLPTEAFYVDPSFTTIINANGYEFKELPIIMQKGDSGEEVEKIDNFLSNYVKGNYFGDYTEANVKIFQKQNNLEETGIIDKITLDKMQEQGLKL